MELQENIVAFTTAIRQSINDNTFVSVTCGNYAGADEMLKNIYIKRILIKSEEKLSFTYRYKTKDIVKNHSVAEAVELIGKQLNEGFNSATLFTTQFDLLFQQTKGVKSDIKKNAPTKKELPSLSHDATKNRLIQAKGKTYLTELKITDAAGNVYKATQDKYKQINHYIEILSSLIKELPAKPLLKVVDMGAGKGYLTFALYDYIKNVLGLNADVTGVEYRADLVALCNAIAKKSDFTNLHFVEGSIEKFETDNTDILIALHACDTATDDAICKGIKTNAELIVVAPCCHKQIRREMEKGKIKNDLGFILQHGIFMEREAEMVTDSIRALILEYFGYKTKVFEFITDAHTPKNIMIVASKNKNVPYKSEAVLQKIKDAKSYFGIGYHHLEKIMGI